MDAVVLQAAFNDTFLEETVESEHLKIRLVTATKIDQSCERAYLLVEFDVCGFELLLNVFAAVVDEHGLRERLALVILRGLEVTSGVMRQFVKRHLGVLRVADLFQLYVRNLLVVGDRGVVRHHVARELGEVACH